MNFCAIFVIVAFFKMASGAGEKVQETPNVDIMSLIKHVIDRLDVMDERTERRFDVVNERLNAINQRFDDVEKRFDGVDGKITKLGSQVQELNTHVRKTDMTLREVIKQSQFEWQEIRNNSKSVAEVAEQTAHLTTVIYANLNNISQDVREVKKALTEGTYCKMVTLENLQLFPLPYPILSQCLSEIHIYAFHECFFVCQISTSKISPISNF